MSRCKKWILKHFFAVTDCIKLWLQSSWSWVKDNDKTTEKWIDEQEYHDNSCSIERLVTCVIVIYMIFYKQLSYFLSQEFYTLRFCCWWRKFELVMILQWSNCFFCVVVDDLTSKDEFILMNSRELLVWSNFYQNKNVDKTENQNKLRMHNLLSSINMLDDSELRTDMWDWKMRKSSFIIVLMMIR